MDTSKIFRSLVLGGASLALSACGPTSSGTDAGSEDAGFQAPVDAGTTADAGTPMDAGGTSDAGAGCTCVPDVAWDSQDCAPPDGGTSVCCWNHPTAACCG